MEIEMKTNQQTFVKLKNVAMIAVAAMCFGSLTAHADWEDAKVTNVISKKIYVLGDGQTYTAVKSGPIATAESLTAHVNFTADAGLSGKVKSWSTWLEIHKHSGTTTFPVIAFKDYSFSYSYPKNNRPKTVDRTETIVVPKSAFNNLFTSQCNGLAQQLRQQGLSNKEIFSTNRSISYQIHAGASASYTGLDDLTHFVGADDSDQTAEIVCMKAPAPTVDTAGSLQTNVDVTDVSLNVLEQSTLGGACKVNLSTVFKTNLPNTEVRYQFEHTNGNKSDIKTVTTSHSKTAMDAHWYDVPLNPNGAEAGSVRIVGVSHDFQSSWKSYNMDCKKPSPNSLSLVTKPTVQLDLLPINNVMHQGMICPTKIKITATLSSQNAFSGTGVVSVKNGQFAFATHKVNLNPNVSWRYDETLDLKPWNTINAPVGQAGGTNTWQTQPGSGAATPSQRFEVRYSLNANQQNVIQTPYKTISVSCTAPKVNQQLLPGKDLKLKAPDVPQSVQPRQLQLKQIEQKQQPIKGTPNNVHIKSYSTSGDKD
jgi:hypothetical protein